MRHPYLTTLAADITDPTEDLGGALGDPITTAVATSSLMPNFTNLVLAAGGWFVGGDAHRALGTLGGYAAGSLLVFFQWHSLLSAARAAQQRAPI